MIDSAKIFTPFLVTAVLLVVISAQSQNPPDQQTGTKVYYEYDAAGNRVLRRIWVEGDGRLAAPEQTTEEELAQQEGYEISAYPNPVSNVLNIDVSPSILDLEEHRLTVSDMNGRIIQQQNIVGVRTRLDVSAMASGNYILKVWAEEHSQEWQTQCS